MGSASFKGYHPEPWQRVVHDYITDIGPDAGKVIVVKAKRQIGKSVLIEQELLRHAINNPRSISICVSLTFANVRKIFKEMLAGLLNSGILANTNESNMELSFLNGSTILFKSCVQGEKLRGYTIKNGGILAIDEAAYIPDVIYNIITPWTDVYKANTLIVSTPRFKRGFFYNFYISGIQGDETVKSFDLCQYDTSKYLSDEKLAMYKKMLPTMQFITEYLGQFADKGAGVFAIENDIWFDIENKDSKFIYDKLNEYDSLWVGIDWGTGTGGDYTALVVINERGEQVLYHIFNYNSPTKQVEIIVDDILKLDVNKIKSIYAEKNSIGTVYIDMLQNKLAFYKSLKVVPFITTNDSKREIVENLVKIIEENKCKLFDTFEQRMHFETYTCEVLSSGKITYNSQYHDDCVIATALAFKAKKDSQRIGRYNLSFK